MTLSQHFPFRLSYSSHLALHSFPTRRSSDLGIVLPAPLNSRVRSAPSPLRVGPPPPLSPAAGARGGGGPTRSGDRKSTRLNSSHRCISYAVFCLKKKNQKERALTAKVGSSTI